VASRGNRVSGRLVERIALGVSTRDRPELLQRCLAPALSDIAAAGYTVVVADQSTDGETERLVRALPGVRYLRTAPGTSRGRNAVVAATMAPLIAFTDDDVSIADGPRWLETMAASFDASDDVGAVCGRAVTPAGRLLPGTPPGIHRWPTNPFGLGSALNMAVARSALEAVGGFDEDLGGGARIPAAEDTDLLYRVLRAGWVVVSTDDATVVHDDWRSGRQEIRLHFGYGFGAGAQTAKYAAAGDRAATRLALREAGRHAVSFAREAAHLRLRSAALQPPFVLGLALGYARNRRRAAAVERSDPPPGAVTPPRRSDRGA
jgi:GT2 family glycosyltransferase